MHDGQMVSQRIPSSSRAQGALRCLAEVLGSLARRSMRPRRTLQRSCLSGASSRGAWGSPLPRIENLISRHMALQRCQSGPNRTPNTRAVFRLTGSFTLGQRSEEQRQCPCCLSANAPHARTNHNPVPPRWATLGCIAERGRVCEGPEMGAGTGKLDFPAP